MSHKFTHGDNLVTIPGPAGYLQAVITLPPILSAQPIIGIVCHPHPLHGGTMHNKVVTTIAKVYRELGLYTVRFNFRGVGQSQGEYAQGIGETEDLLAVIDWIKQQLPQASIWLAGFSFGSYVVARASSQRSISHMLWIAPPVVSFDFSVLALPKRPCLLVQGDADEVVDAKQVYTCIQALSIPIQVINMPGATHFFHGRLLELHSLLLVHLKDYL